MPLRLATAAMGTRFELVLAGRDERSLRAAGGRALRAAGEAVLRAAGEAALAEIEECDRQLSLFRRDSLLARINRCAAASPVRLDLDTFELFAACARVHAASRGAFDPSVAPLLRALGHHDAAPAHGTAAAGFGDVMLDADAGTIRFRRPGMALDLGGVAKGHALDLAGRTLREAGVTRALFHGGTSTTLAIGAPPDAAAWRVRVEPGAGAPVAALVDGALSVSARHGRVVDGAGHVVDPRDGRAVESAAVVAVAHGSAREADAWSTALLVLGAGAHDTPETGDLAFAVGDGPPGARRWRSSGAARTHFSFPTATAQESPA